MDHASSLYECIFELRHQEPPNVRPLVTEVLARLGIHCVDRLELLPPPLVEHLRQQDDSMRYVPTRVERFGDMSLLVGESVLSVSFAKPCPDWHSSKQRFTAITDALRVAKFLTRPERLCLRCVHIITSGSSELDLSPLNLAISLGSMPLDGTTLSLHAQFSLPDCFASVAIRNGTGIRPNPFIPSPPVGGIFFSIEAIPKAVGEGLAGRLSQLAEQAHEVHDAIYADLVR